MSWMAVWRIGVATEFEELPGLEVLGVAVAADAASLRRCTAEQETEEEPA